LITFYPGIRGERDFADSLLISRLFVRSYFILVKDKVFLFLTADNADEHGLRIVSALIGVIRGQRKK